MSTVQIGENSYELADLPQTTQELIARASELRTEENNLAMRIQEVKALSALYSSAIIQAVEPVEEVTEEV